MKHQFSKASDVKLSTCHKDLQKILTTAIEICPIDFGIAEGHRSVELQQQYFKEGKSKVDGINIKGKHNLMPSEAADIFLFINGKASWNQESLCFVIGVITAVAELLFLSGDVQHRIRWGGNWDLDGEILTDQTFDDLPHIELIKD